MARDQHAPHTRSKNKIDKPTLHRARTSSDHNFADFLSCDDIDDIMSIGLIDTNILGDGTAAHPFDMTVDIGTPAPATPPTTPPGLEMVDRLLIAERAFDMAIQIARDNLRFLRKNVLRQEEHHGCTAHTASMRMRIQHLEVTLGKLEQEELIMTARMTPRRLFHVNEDSEDDDTVDTDTNMD